MSIICNECGFENEDGDVVCAMCSAQLTIGNTKNSDPIIVVEEVAAPNVMSEDTLKTIPQMKTSTNVRYFVNCENSRTKTMLTNKEVTSFYCEGCKEEHQIEGFFWYIQEEHEEMTSESASSDIIEQVQNSNVGQRLVLEDIVTHVKIEIDKAGGTLGRYGTYGANYLQSDPRGRMVSGEHCRFKYEYGRWSIEHLSRTNDTVYNGRKLEHGYEEALRNDKIITLANAISFRVGIY